ncbi:hypothetical protein QAD02_010618 [Eretmocerus hayati]|uniref:Uncharacterized protein n=1 Tax=Eretmocerus hayati TaxID=131215 RepID=A0ACC2NX84_9HYME|nr:hypothetical protein QAD02_010618 [Eretmocerus hayati]
MRKKRWTQKPSIRISSSTCHRRGLEEMIFVKSLLLAVRDGQSSRHQLQLYLDPLKQSVATLRNLVRIWPLLYSRGHSFLSHFALSAIDQSRHEHKSRPLIDKSSYLVREPYYVLLTCGIKIEITGATLMVGTYSKQALEQRSL